MAPVQTGNTHISACRPDADNRMGAIHLNGSGFPQGNIWYKVLTWVYLLVIYRLR